MDSIFIRFLYFPFAFLFGNGRSTTSGSELVVGQQIGGSHVHWHVWKCRPKCSRHSSTATPSPARHFTVPGVQLLWRPQQHVALHALPDDYSVRTTTTTTTVFTSHPTTTTAKHDRLQRSTRSQLWVIKCFHFHLLPFQIIHTNQLICLGTWGGMFPFRLNDLSRFSNIAINIRDENMKIGASHSKSGSSSRLSLIPRDPTLWIKVDLILCRPTSFDSTTFPALMAVPFKWEPNIFDGWIWYADGHQLEPAASNFQPSTRRKRPRSHKNFWYFSFPFCF